MTNRYVASAGVLTLVERGYGTERFQPDAIFVGSYTYYTHSFQNTAAHTNSKQLLRLETCERPSPVMPHGSITLQCTGASCMDQHILKHQLLW